MNEQFLKVAKKAALEAGRIINKYSQKEHQKTLKNEDKSDFVTETDLESERAIVKILTGNFPDHNIIAEEESKVNKGSEYTWVIDPLDGTISFTKGLPFFAVSIGLVKGSQPVVGVIYDISSRSLYFAQKGKGTFLNSQPITVSKQPDLEAAAVDLDFGHRATRVMKMEAYAYRLATKVGYLYAFAPAAGIMGLVSKGNLDAYVAGGWIWDFAAGAVIVKEAGGKVTDFEGQEPDWSKDRLSIVASNGLIHDQILEALKK